MRILFADDSMTAQNMGKKILTEAGYEVVAVSNGAAAVKKIAEQKPDIIILDIYMPGYTGLEVCDKVRASVETLRTPVLLTVGKMEPYRAEDANRVKADGVIIKPFEASDLLAVIKKLEERVMPKAVTVASADETILLERPPDLADFAPLPSQNHTEINLEPTDSTVPSIVDVPDNMATSAAFSDLLGSEPVHAFDPFPAPAPEPVPMPELVVTPEPVAAAPKFTALPDEFVTSAVSQEPSAAFEPEAIHEEGEPAVASVVAIELTTETAAPIPDTQPIPVYQEPDFQDSQPAAGSAVEAVEDTTQPELGAVDIWDAGQQAELEVAPTVPPSEPSAAAETTAPPAIDTYTWDSGTAEPSTPLDNSAVFAAATLPAPEAPSPAFVEPGVDSFSAKVEAQIEQLEAMVSASEARNTESPLAAPVEEIFHPAASSAETPAAVDDDFEARVAAAMSIYDNPAAELVEPAPVVPDEVKPAPIAVEVKAEPESAPTPYTIETTHEPVPELTSFEAPYSFEYSPPVSSPKVAFEGIPQSVASVERLEAVEEISHHPTEPAVSVQSEPVSHEPSMVAESDVVPHYEPPRAATQPAPAHPEQTQVDDEMIISEVESQLQDVPVAAAADPGETQIISAVVHRVLERLKPQLIEEIARELRENKNH